MGQIRSRRWMLLALVLATASCGTSSTGAVEGGPLADTDAISDETAFTVDLDRTYSWGVTTVSNSGSAPAVVEKVSLGDGEGTIRTVGVRALPVDTPMTVGFAPGFDADAGLEVEGLVVPPGEGNGYTLVFGLEVDDKGVSQLDGVHIRYRVGKTQFETTLDHVVILCAPVEEYEECPPPDSASTDASRAGGVPRTRQGEG